MAWKPVNYGDDRNPGVWDTGNGSLRYVADNADYPGIERVTIRSYCGRNAEDCRFYRLTDDPDQTFDTLNKAQRAWRKFVKFIHIDEPRKWVEPK